MTKTETTPTMQQREARGAEPAKVFCKGSFLALPIFQRDDMKIEPIRLGNQLGNRRLAQQMTPPRFVRTADDNMPDSVSAAKFEKRFHRLFRTQAHHFSAQIPCSLFVLHKIALQGRIDAMTRFLLVST